jgi:hypothetical protein
MSSPWNWDSVLPKGIGLWFDKQGWHGGYLLVHDDGDRIVQDTFPENDGVQLGINFIRIEDGENRDGIRGRERWSKDEAFQEREP